MNPSTPAGARRPYESQRRREQAQETRARIAAAARDLFVEHGWAGTRVRDVASSAGVAEPTVYAAYGSKAGLALALVDAADMSADASQTAAELKAAAGDPARELAALVGFDRRLFERGGDIIALLHDAGRSEPALQSAYEEGRSRGERVRSRVFANWPARAYRKGQDAETAADTFAALCNIDVYRVLSLERGWSPERIERWWLDSLSRLLLR